MIYIYINNTYCFCVRKYRYVKVSCLHYACVCFLLKGLINDIFQNIAIKKTAIEKRYFFEIIKE